ncbi:MULTISPECIES: O-antigen ligase [unclassified Rhizobium]|uniref:O-antigen ligase family protein n=1 Tax=unclassified Rhizobium TaxID=2613769 RepID=UPI000A7B70C1|nr:MULTISPECIES: O-antigen ligase [unclassified Rhizobium]
MAGRWPLREWTGGDGHGNLYRHGHYALRNADARIAIPQEVPEGAAVVMRVVTTFLAGFGLFIMILTLNPFMGDVVSEADGGGTANVVNQIGYLGLGGLFVFFMLGSVPPRTLLQLISPSWLIVFAIAYFSCMQSYDPNASARGVTLSLVAMLMVAGVLVLPRSEKDFVEACANAVLLLLIINYAALVLLPERAIHQASALESWHAGYWRGHLSHKNVSAPVFSVLAMFGIYCIRSGARLRGWAITLLAVIFVLHTGSKTTIGFLPLAIGIVLCGSAIRSPAAIVISHLCLAVLVTCLTVGTIYSPGFLAMTAAVLDDPTFTGRDAIWQFASESIAAHPWFGHGYASFWQSPVIRGMEANFEADWDVRGIVSAHNAYLDALLTFGIPGGAVMILLLFVKPLVDYLRAARRRGSRNFSEFCVMVVIFMTYNGMLESFILNRADPMWMLLALAVFGLNMAARCNLRHNAD